jgi:hypothetical protein
LAILNIDLPNVLHFHKKKKIEKFIIFQFKGMKSSFTKNINENPENQFKIFDKYYEVNNSYYSDTSSNHSSSPSNHSSSFKNTETKENAGEQVFGHGLNSEKFLPSYIRHPSWNGRDDSKPSSKENNFSESTSENTNIFSQNLSDSTSEGGLEEQFNEFKKRLETNNLISDKKSVKNDENDENVDLGKIDISEENAENIEIFGNIEVFGKLNKVVRSVLFLKKMVREHKERHIKYAEYIETYRSFRFFFLFLGIHFLILKWHSMYPNVFTS